MGARKRQRAQAIKEARKDIAIAKLNNCHTSPRKMRLVSDMIRGADIEKAMFILKHSGKEASAHFEKLLLSALNNWEQRNEGFRMEKEGLFVREIYVNNARMLKRIQPAPRGRAHPIRKRSNHVTVIVDTRNKEAATREKEQVVKGKN